MITINRTDGTKQIIRPGKEFYATTRVGKDVLTPQNKAMQIAYDLTDKGTKHDTYAYHSLNTEKGGLND